MGMYKFELEIRTGIMIITNYNPTNNRKKRYNLYRVAIRLFTIERRYVKKKYLTTVFMFTLLVVSKGFAQIQAQPTVKPNEVTRSVQALLNYSDNHLRLKQKFTAYDERMNVISKENFIKQLTSGKYLPLRIKSEQNKFIYKLYVLPAGTHRDIGRLTKQIGETYYGFMQVEGKVMPAFKFVDLKGNIYTPENTKGKIIALKAWFLSCVPCIAEMPELNKLKAKYAKRKDILFLSIAFDPKEKLIAFSKKNSFNYAIIPVSAQFIEQKLMATGYPAHWVINKKGVVVDMSYDKDIMMAALEKEAAR